MTYSDIYCTIQKLSVAVVLFYNNQDMSQRSGLMNVYYTRGF